MTRARTSIHGKRLGLGPDDELISNSIQISRPAVDVSIAIGDESSNVRTITMQFKDAKGKDIDYVEHFNLHVFTSSALTAYATTGGSTGVAIGSDGALLAVVAKKIFSCTTEADGDWDGTWTDDASESVSLAVELPNGRMVPTAAFANSTA